MSRLNGETAVQLEFDFFTPYHRLLDLVTDAKDTGNCGDRNPALWYAFCRLNHRPYDTHPMSVWTQRDIADWANMKIRQQQGGH